MLYSRRNFLKTSGLLSASMALPQFLQAQNRQNNAPGNDNILVVIQLSGGNDGLNMLVPYENDIYYNARPKIALKKQEIIPLKSLIGLHPALKDFKKFYDAGNLTVLFDVGYPNPDRSHFRSMDIWHTASAAEDYLHTGWLGRYLDEKQNPDAKLTRAFEIDDSLSLALKGENYKAMAFTNAKKLDAQIADPLFKLLHKAEEEHEGTAAYLYKTFADTMQSADYIYQTVKPVSSAKTYPNSAFGKGMKTIVELIISGIETQVYYISLGSFDTHNNQQKRQADLFEQLNNSLAVFYEDIKQQAGSRNVTTMIFSEFGRRVEENASMGTDHGAANPVLLIGNNLKTKGYYNSPSDLKDLDEGDLKYRINFRDIYATVLNDYLKTDAARIIDKKDFVKMNLF